MTCHRDTSRRDFLKETLAFTAAVAAARASHAEGEASLAPGQLPKIRLGKLEVSRLILGSNPFWGWSHGNPQGTDQQMRDYYTDGQIMKVLDAAADQGITAVWTPCYDRWIRLWNEYEQQGGKMKFWIAQPHVDPDKMKEDITLAAKNGAKAICIQGIRVDEQMNAGKFDVVRDWLEHIKSYGLPAGMATHGARTHLVAEEKGLPTDFYHQTLYRPDTYVREGLEESLATIEKLTKPVVAYKALGAGRVMPAETLPYIFKRLKPKDGVCIGVYPKTRDEIAENAGLVKKLSGR
jgi:hypothetical protein